MKERTKGFIGGVMVSLLIVAMSTTVFAAYQKMESLYYDNIKITLDGDKVIAKTELGNTVEPFTIDGTTYLPVRGLSSALGLNVAWDQDTKTVILTTPGNTPHTPDPAAPTFGQTNALKKANEYLKVMAFSRSGLIKQLEYEGFSNSDAEYAAANCGANWNEQAAKKVKEYLNVMSFSREGLIKQLLYEGFTQAQAEYGVNAVGY